MTMKKISMQDLDDDDRDSRYNDTGEYDEDQFPTDPRQLPIQ